MAAPSSVPPTPANGSSTSSPVRVKNSIRRAISRGGLFAPWALARGVAELGRVGRRQQRLGEVQPLLAGQLVERVVGVGRRRPTSVIAASLADATATAQSGIGRTRALEWPMPVRYASARFVGREAAFAALATGLDDAAHGRTTDAPARGHGRHRCHPLPRRGDRRIDALHDPMTVLRAAAWPAHADEPYGPIVRADRSRRCSVCRTTRCPACSVRRRPRSSGSCPNSARVSRRSARRPTTAARPPRAAPGTDARGDPRAPRAARGAASGRARPRGPAPRRRRDPGAGHVPRPDRRATSGWPSSARTSRTSSRATTRGPRTSPPSWPARDPTGWPCRRSIATSWPLLIEGIEGERASASLLLLVAERSGGLPLVAEELLAARRELPSVSLTGSFEELVIARMAVRSQECRRVLRLLALAERPLTSVAAGGRRRRLRGRTPAAPRHGRSPARGSAPAPSTRTCGRASPRRSRTASWSSGTRRSSSGTTRSARPSPGTCCRSPGRATTPRWRRAWAGRRRRSRRTGSRRTTRPRRGRPPSTPRRRPRLGYAAADELAALELALSLPERPTSGCAAGAAPTGPDLVDLQERASEAAFAVGRMSRATAYLEAAIGGLDGRRDRVRLGLLHERLAHIRRAAGDPAGAMHARPTRRRAGPARAEPGTGDGRWPPWPSSRCSTGSSPTRSGSPREAMKVARACDPVARTQEVHALTTLAVAMAWGSDPAASVELLREAEAGARELDDPDALFRVRANLTTVLDLMSRRTEAVEVAYQGIEDARRAGLEAVYGNFLAGNVADTLFLLGRWYEARERERTGDALAAGRGRLPRLGPPARDRRDRDRRRRGGVAPARPDDPRVRRGARTAARRAVLPRGGLVRAVARRHRRRQPIGRARLGERPRDRGVAARRADGVDGRPGRRGRGASTPASIASSRRWPRPGSGRPRCSTRDRSLVACRSARRRPDRAGWPTRHWPRPARSSGGSRARTTRRCWRDVARGWAGLEAPYDVALARWREAEAMLASGAGRSGRTDARAPLLEAVELGLQLGAKPLLRELRELAGRARIVLPPEVDALLDARPAAAAGPGHGRRAGVRRIGPTATPTWSG